MIDQRLVKPRGRWDRQLEHHLLPFWKMVELLAQGGEQEVVARIAIDALDVNLGLEDRHHALGNDLRRHLELLRDKHRNPRLIGRVDYRAFLGAEHAQPVRAVEQGVESGDRLHHLDAVDLLLQSLADLEEGHDVLDPPEVVGGVATVVAKLFNITRPDLAFFGEKDFQQLRIVSRMATDLDTGVGVIGCPIVRDATGLALSSRNAFLSADERAVALALPEALSAAAAALAWGERDPRGLEAVMAETVASMGAGAVLLDYAAVVNSNTLEPAETTAEPLRALIAARVGTIRLIDNCALVVPAPSGV